MLLGTFTYSGRGALLVNCLVKFSQPFQEEPYTQVELCYTEDLSSPKNDQKER